MLHAQQREGSSNKHKAGQSRSSGIFVACMWTYVHLWPIHTEMCGSGNPPLHLCITPLDLRTHIYTYINICTHNICNIYIIYTNDTYKPINIFSTTCAETYILNKLHSCGHWNPSCIVHAIHVVRSCGTPYAHSQILPIWTEIEWSLSG